jgi:Bacterial Ig-like domain/Lamin Tail Domain/Secretion system C-terminal sorting domain
LVSILYIQQPCLIIKTNKWLSIMKKIYISFTAVFLIFFHFSFSQVVINEVYGGGGNSGSTYKNDFIELYNNGNADVNLAGWSVQYASAAGATWQVTNLTGTILAHGHYLIQESLGAGGTTPLPTPDASGSIALSATAGKVILCNVATAQTGTNPTGAQVIDKVGFGAAANGFEGAGPTSAPANATSVQRTPEGTDTDNNNADFTVISPTPLNSTGVSDVTPPITTAFLPADDATGIVTNSALSISFSENITASSGLLKINNATAGTFDYVDVLSPNVAVSGSTVTISGINLQPATDYYITIPDSVFKDLAGNKYAGIANNTSWNFSTSSTAATAVNGIVDHVYNLDGCGTTFGSDGFKQYSVTGGLTWACTTFGRDAANSPKGNAPSGLEMNGFDSHSQTNTVNEDWLLSPKFDLTGIAYPLLSFYSRTKFNGAPLQLKASTDYPGFGDPRSYTWTDLNGRLPGQTSDSWTLSSQINLQAFNLSSAVYIAFVYTSTNDDGARWTLDDISLINSATPPPPSLTISSTDIQFFYTAIASTSTKNFTLTGNDLTGGGGITLTTSGSFMLSKDNSTYASSITFTEAEANNIAKTVYVQFAPLQDNQNYAAGITISTSGVNDTTVNLTGNSIDPAKTLEVVNWNLEWFATPDPTLGPVNKTLQKQNVRTILQNIGADLFTLVEVVDTASLGDIVRNSMPGYSYIICNYGSHANPFETGPTPMGEVQKEAFVYKTALFSNIDTSSLLNTGVNTAGDLSNPDYNFWSSGRYPFMMTADVILNGTTKRIRFVALHAKANTSPTLTAYSRRKSGADDLHSYLNATYPTDNIVILGDFNDDLDSTITDGISPRISSYSSFTGDAANFYSPTLNGLSLAGKKSTVSFNDVIDHVVVSNEMKSFYMNNSAAVLTDVANLVSNYGTTTSDHYPVFTQFAFDAALVPIKLLNFTALKQNNTVKISWETTEEISSKEFVVERSTDGSVFSAIGKISAKGIASGYSLTDANPVTGNNFYRLKMVDQDGKFEYSRIVKVYFSKQLIIHISPNPATTFVNINIENINTPVTVQLVDLNGKLVKQQIISQGVQNSRLSLTGLMKGLYTIKLIGTTQVTAQKLLIQ